MYLTCSNETCFKCWRQLSELEKYLYIVQWKRLPWGWICSVPLGLSLPAEYWLDKLNNTLKIGWGLSLVLCPCRLHALLWFFLHPQWRKNQGALKKLVSPRGLTGCWGFHDGCSILPWVLMLLQGHSLLSLRGLMVFERGSQVREENKY